MIFELALSLLFVWLVSFVFQIHFKRKNMPPGPFPLPWIGNLPQIMSNPLKPFEKLNKQYGDIFAVSTPAGTIVVLSTMSLAREARLGTQQDLAGRLPEPIYPWPDIFGNDIVTSDYSTGYRFRKRVFKTAMHIFGAGIQQAQDRVRQAVEIMIKEIELKEGQPFCPRSLIESSLIVQNWEWLTSKKISLDNSIVKRLSKFSDIVSRQALQSSLYSLLPFLKYVPSQFMRDISLAQQIKEETYPPEFRVHVETYQPNVVRDLTDSFIQAYKKEISKQSGKDIGKLSDIPNLMLDVVFASETSSSTLAWFILYMVRHEDIQIKIHSEIIDVVGKDHLPQLEDAQSMPYLQATLCEVLRLSASFPQLASNAVRDMTIGGYHIPKDTFVLIDLDKLHHDEKEWLEPYKFMPERFLDDGNFVGWNKKNSFFPFGLGNRECLGSSLAKITLFMFTSILLQRYKIELPGGADMPSNEVKTPAFIRRPQNFQIIAKKRLDDCKL